MGTACTRSSCGQWRLVIEVFEFISLAFEQRAALLHRSISGDTLATVIHGATKLKALSLLAANNSRRRRKSFLRTHETLNTDMFAALRDETLERLDAGAAKTLDTAAPCHAFWNLSL